MESTSLGSCSRPSSLRPRSPSVWLTPSLSGANSVTPLVGSLSVSARRPQLVSAAEQDAAPAPVQLVRSAGSRCGRRRAEADSKRLDWLAMDTTTGSQLTACSQTGGLQMHCVPRQALNPSVPAARGRGRTGDVGVGGVDQAQQRGVLAMVLQEAHEAAIGGRRGRGRGRRGRRGGRGRARRAHAGRAHGLRGRRGRRRHGRGGGARRAVGGGRRRVRASLQQVARVCAARRPAVWVCRGFEQAVAAPHCCESPG